MKERLKNTFDTNSIVFSVILFCVFAILVYLFPYSGDDWAWGSEIGVSRLQTLFDNYNGRYAGNLLVMLLTRSKLLCMVVIPASLVALCLLPKLFCNSKKLSSLSFAALMLFLVPKQIMVQSIVWTAGFANYVPPILIIAVYLASVKNIFEEKEPQYSKFLPLFSFIAGFISSLFMENVTLYGLAISACIILYSFFKHRKVFMPHISNLIGCAAGAILMFSNSAYTSIANSEDTYRSTAEGSNFAQTIFDHFQVISDQFFFKNLPLLFFTTILCVLIAFIHVKNCDKTDKILTLFSVFLNTTCLILFFAKKEFTHWLISVDINEPSDVTNLFFICLIFLYCFSALAISFMCISNNTLKWKAVFSFVSVPVLIAPLLVVNPIGPRCFFPPYFMMIMFCICIFEYIAETLALDNIFTLGISFTTISASAAIVIFLISIYSNIHTYDVKRLDYIQKQINAGYETITVCKLPYTSYVWTGDPSQEPWETRYKLFYDIDKEKEFTLLPYSEFNKWANNFDKEVSD